MTGLIIAMESELQAIVERMEDVTETTIASVTFYQGKLKGTDIVAALAGVGKVAAAIASTLMCQVFKPALLINIGVAGGLLNEQNVTDMVLSTEILQADFDTTPIDGPQGLGKRFKADETLLAKGEKTAAALGIHAWKGAVATQDIFMSREEDFDRLMKNFPEAACSEMEGGAVAQTAEAFDIPVLVIRSLSDVVHHEGNPMEFSQFTALASKRAADFMEAWCALSD